MKDFFYIKQNKIVKGSRHLEGGILVTKRSISLQLNVRCAFYNRKHSIRLRTHSKYHRKDVGKSELLKMCCSH